LQFFELVGQFYTTAIPHFASIFHDRSNKWDKFYLGHYDSK
jgi:hypothetical protein